MEIPSVLVTDNNPDAVKLLAKAAEIYDEKKVCKWNFSSSFEEIIGIIGREEIKVLVIDNYFGPIYAPKLISHLRRKGYLKNTKILGYSLMSQEKAKRESTFDAFIPKGQDIDEVIRKCIKLCRS